MVMVDYMFISGSLGTISEYSDQNWELNFQVQSVWDSIHFQGVFFTFSFVLWSNWKI